MTGVRNDFGTPPRAYYAYWKHWAGRRRRLRAVASGGCALGYAMGLRQPVAARWRREWLGRGLWLVALAGVVYTLIPGFPQFWALLRTPCAGAACLYQQLTFDQARSLRGWGLTIDAYAGFTLTLAICSSLVCLAISALLVWRRPGDRMAVLVALLLLSLIPITMVASLVTGAEPWRSPFTYAVFADVVLLAVVFSLFPTGQFAPRWMRWVLIPLLVIQVPADFLPVQQLAPNAPASNPGWLLVVAEMAVLLVAQVYRYHRVSTPLQRQQTKWVVVGLAIPIIILAAGTVFLLATTALDLDNTLFALLYNEADFLLPLLIAMGFGFAVMRYRLWEIDTLINRALVYGALTLLLTALYAGLVIGLQTALRGVTGQDNNAAIVVSTLVIAALVQPARRAIQTLIARRFYRRRYDAARTLHAFSDTLRHEIRVEALRERLLGVVDETMRPASISLWLRPQPVDEQTARRRSSEPAT